ncbi:hypothetical protein RhiirA4_454666 [Rhizophagus irregularis]|uniref:Uncharacterized protein n=1 Tax=Rhizophagus irregularis TaxID=588596 RepID=A0A2I1G3D6_9GLOM|nr:hypothetical protein RhiirA4_454666 [Rhizophagus irregularis]
MRSDMGLSKRSFKNYHKDFPRSNNNQAGIIDSTIHTRRNYENIYVNPYNDFRNFKLHKDFLYILFSSSNFLHSGPFYKHLESNNVINYTSPICIDDNFIYNV